MDLITVTKPYDILLFALSSVLCGILAHRVTTGYEARGTETFGLLLGLVSFWAANSVVKLTVQSWTVQAIIVRTDFVLLFVVPITWFVFAARYTGRDVYRGRPFVVAVVAIVASGLFLAVVNPGSLVFRSLATVQEPFFHLHPVVGVLYWPHLLAGYAFLLAGIWFLLSVLLTTNRNELPVGMLLVGSLFPIGFNLEYVFGFGVFHGVDYTSMGVALFAVLSTAAVSRNLLDTAPISQDIVMRNIRGGILVVDTDGRVINYNDEAAALADPSVDGLTGAALADAFPSFADGVDFGDDAVEAITDPTRRAAYEPDPSATVVQTTGPDGRTRDYSVTVSRINRGSFHLGWSLVLTDITELQETQRELQRQNEQLDEFASTVSHDLRNPLTVLGGTAELIEEPIRAVHDGDRQPETLDTGELLDYVERIQTTSLRMEAIIDDLLTLTAQGKTVTESEELNLAAVANAASECVETHESTLRVERNGVILGSRTRVQTIIENLLRNAIEHAGRQATVTIGVEDGGFYVQDDGPGIPADEVDRIFDYGYTSRQQGTGLGLAIVKTMAEAHGWSVGVATDYTGGTRIRFSGVDVVETDPAADASPTSA